ncbi:MAG: protein kinase [bacterium]
MEDLIGKTIENYKFDSILGRGGMGVVYKAHDIKLDRFVAIKILSPNVVDKAKFIERFKREARNQAQLTHQNIVTVYGFIEYNDLLGIVMEMVEGESLEQIIERKKRLHINDAVFIIQQVLVGMGYAHSKGYIHRDIKPSNILITRDGTAKIMDFGISKSLFEKGVTKTGAKIGTVLYMSPEQIRGEHITHHSDIYAIGCTLYEALVGEPPFYLDSEFDVMEGHLKKTPPKVAATLPKINPLVDKIIGIALAKNPNERYDSCEAFMVDIRELDKLLITTESDIRALLHPIKKISKTTSILATIGIALALLVIAYFSYVQVDRLLTSKKLDKLKKYSFKTLFESQDTLEFKKLVKVQRITENKLNSIFFVDTKRGFVLGDSGTVFQTNDSGKTWDSVKIGTKINIYDGYFFNDGRSYLVGDSSSFIYSKNFFQEFRIIKLSGEYSLFKIKFINDNIGFILGTSGLILKTTDGGANWNKVSSNSKEVLFDVEFIDESDGFIIGWNGTILKTTDQGQIWKMQEKFSNNYLRSIDFRNKELGLISGGDEIIYRTDDGGKYWKPISTSHPGGIQKVEFIDDEFVIAAGSRGMLLLSNDAGETWRLNNTGKFVNFTNFIVSESKQIILVGVNGTILKLK